MTGRGLFGKYLWGRGKRPSPPLEIGNRPADTIENIADYLWYLLPGFLKKKPRPDSIVGNLQETTGDLLNEARETLTGLVPMAVIETSKGVYLDRLGRARKTPRAQHEDDGAYKLRVRDAWQKRLKAGTIPA